MNGRVAFRWAIKLMNEKGEHHTEEVVTFWSPDSEGVRDAVTMCGQVQAWLRSKKTLVWQPVGMPELLPAK
jgi:hypothetical protein